MPLVTKPITTYGLSEQAQIRATEIRHEAGRMRFTAEVRDADIVVPRLSVGDLRLLGFLALGLLSGFGHCALMCSPFVLLVPRRYVAPGAAAGAALKPAVLELGGSDRKKIHKVLFKLTTGGELARDGQTFFAQRIVSFLPEMSRRRFRARTTYSSRSARRSRSRVRSRHSARSTSARAA